MSTDQQDLSEQEAKLYKFMRNFLNTDFPASFILEKCFHYAIGMQYELAAHQCAMNGIEFDYDEMNTDWMNQASIWLKKVVLCDVRLYSMVRSR